jgi:uncharacterized protein (TIGR00255 family)
MTGFGSVSSRQDGVSYQVELRAVNNKFYKSTIRLPETLQSLEAEIDSCVSKSFARGSITLSVKYVDTSQHGTATINTESLKHYINQIKEVEDSPQVDVGSLLSLPGVLTSDSDEDIVARLRPAVIALVEEACDSAVEMRQREGKALQEDLENLLSSVSEHLSHIKERAPEIVAEYQTRLRLRMESLLSEIGKNVAEEDMLKEIAIFAERTDIAEEISRLDGHIDQFKELVDGSDEEPIGRTLDFLAQEMLREANTIASKCLDGSSNRRIVEVKGAIDRIKEQVQNTE